MPRKPWEFLLCIVVLPSIALAAKTYVETPAVEWDRLLPYVRANIVPDLHDNEFHVFVCQGQTDRSVVTPFDDTLSDFAKILVMQAMRNDAKVVDELEAVTERFRRRVSSLSVEERARYRDVFWETLSGAPHMLPAIRSLFTSSRNAGRLRCCSCDHDPSFAPLARRIRNSQ